MNNIVNQSFQKMFAQGKNNTVALKFYTASFFSGRWFLKFVKQVSVKLISKYNKINAAETFSAKRLGAKAPSGRESSTTPG
jgi:hypothetical protein